MTASGLWRTARSCWGSCCSRTLATAFGRRSLKDRNEPGPDDLGAFRRCATATRAAAGASRAKADCGGYRSQLHHRPRTCPALRPLGALELVEQRRGPTPVSGAGGHGRRRLWGRSARQTFADAGRKLVARVPGRPDRTHFPKDDFVIDLAGADAPVRRDHTHTIVPAGKADGLPRGGYTACPGLPVRRGRMPDMTAVPVHRSQGQEGTAGADPSPGRPPAGGTGVAAERRLRRISSRRVAVEHLVGPTGPVGPPPVPLFRQGRKTRFQLYLAATVANLTLVAGKIELSDSVGGGAEAYRASAVMSRLFHHGVVANATAIFGAVRLGILWTVILLKPALLPNYPSPQPGLFGPVSRRSSSLRPRTFFG